MKKYNKLIILLIISIIPVLLFISNDKVEADSSGPMDKYGYKVSIVKYSGTGDPELVGKPILVYQDGLFGDVVKTIQGSYPSGTGEEAYKSFINNNWGVSQFVQNPDITESSDDDWNSYDPNKPSYAVPGVIAAI